MTKEILKVVKIGGSIIDDETSLFQFLENFSTLKGKKILVHGGGKLATQLSNKMGVEVKMVEGRRITDAETLDIITMVYAGKINKNIIANLQRFNCNSVGFTGADGNSVVSKKRLVKEIDFGFAGDVEKVNIDVLEILINNKTVPVFCAITHDNQGQLLNTNADTMAAEIAIAFAKIYNVELFYCFEKAGVLMDVADESSIIETIDTSSYSEMKNAGVIADGMLPKLKNCFYAIENKVEKVCLGKTEMLFENYSKFTTIKA
ncbi:N-acetylglutamate kinase [Flavobacteriaceae bacterium MAR_2010_188]|nr:N-acetylglutamate kinase [Flavobacteriaceae bacterium MAR_2010_188]